MSQAIRIWTSATFHPAYRCGGWACISVAQGQTAGAAGGERNTTESRMALAGLAAALHGFAPGDTPIEVRTTSPALALFADVLSHLTAQSLPPDDRDLWDRILKASARRRVAVTHMPISPNTPTSFIAAWADLARDKAKSGGAFSAAIPRTNLAKVAGLGTT